MHFTYRVPSDNLMQGDIIARDAELDAALEKVHPHFVSEDCQFYMVVTQSCDLVLRKKVTKARYITIAAVRPLRIAVMRELDQIRTPIETQWDIASERKKEKIRNFLGSLFNNNEKGYFFLFKQDDSGLNGLNCAFLRLTVSIESSDYYDLLKENRVLSLSPEFQAKFGWLIGDLYSRVGTEDFSEIERVTYKKTLQEESDSLCQWVPHEKHPELLSKLAAGEIEEGGDLSQIVEDIHVASKAERVAAMIVEHAAQNNIVLPEEFGTQLARLPSLKRLLTS